MMPRPIQRALLHRPRGWVLPFAGLRFRLARGVWCTHETWLDYPASVERVETWEPGDGGRSDGWRMIDMGRRQMRRCRVCEGTEFR